MTRIAHVTDCYLPRLGGIEMQVHDLAMRQRARGHDVTVFTSTSADRSTADPPWVRRVGVEAHPAGRNLGAIRSIGRELPSGKLDVVHVHVSVLSPLSTAAAKAAVASGTAVVVTVHSLWSGLGPLPGVAQRLLGLRGWPLVWTSVSDKAAQPLRKMLGPDRPVDVLVNGIDAAWWNVTRPMTDPAAVTIVSVMRLAPRKRPIQLLEMLARVRKLVDTTVMMRLVVVGDGPLRADLVHFARRHQMTDWLELPGRLERTRIRDVFAASDVYVAPARLESFGIAALEARSAGLPVVASTRGGVGEFVVHGQEGLLADDDADMVRAIASITADRGLRQQIAHHNRTTAPAVTWESVLSHAQTLYAKATDLAAAAPTRAQAVRR